MAKMMLAPKKWQYKPPKPKPSKYENALGVIVMSLWFAGFMYHTYLGAVGGNLEQNYDTGQIYLLPFNHGVRRYVTHMEVVISNALPLSALVLLLLGRVAKEVAEAIGTKRKT